MSSHRLLVILGVLYLTGCANLTRDTNQFYQAQTYLPLAKVPDASYPTHDGRCAAGPVIHQWRDDPQRNSTKPLPGMTLRVVETTYSSTRDDATPALSEWHWTIPAPSDASACALDGLAVPRWDRGDLLRVRHLLSRAQHPQSQSPTTQYFFDAVAATCSPGGSLPGCYEAPLLDKFVAGLAVNLRGQMDREPSYDQVTDGMYVSPPKTVLAIADVDAVGATSGLGRWYAALTMPRRGDLFVERSQAAHCARAFVDSGAPPPRTQNADVCQFAMASLEWRGEDMSEKLPGTTLGQLSKLWLLRSGDPLLLMQPAAYRAPLDASSRNPCNGDPACPLDRRMSQGFVHFELQIPIVVKGAGPTFVSVGKTVGAFERDRGRNVKEIYRSLDWLPKQIAVADQTPPVDVRVLVLNTGRVTLRFAEHAGLGKGLNIASAQSGRLAKDDMLFAPGDIVVLED